MLNLTVPATSRTELSNARDSAKALLDTTNPPSADQVVTAGQSVVTASESIDNSWRRMAGVRLTLGLAVIGLVPGLVLIIGQLSDKRDWTWAGDELRYHAVAAAATALMWIIVGAIFGNARGGLVRTIIGKGNRLSTSKLQIMLWTFAISYAFLLFIVYYIWKEQAVGFDTLHADYLILLGGPFAAALLAQAATVSKVNGNELQQPDKPAPGTTDLVEDPSGNASTTDAQFLVFNLVALIYFYAALIQDSTSLPDLPDTLVGLTGLSALTYVGGKLTNANGPVIKSISIVSGNPDGSLHADNVIRILGENFVASPTQPEVTLKTVVLFGATESIPTSISAKEIVVPVPPALPKGPVLIRVRTGAPAVSDPYTPPLSAA